VEELRILLVEDDAADAAIMQRNVRSSDVSLRIDVALSGEHALELLGSGSGLPDLIFLDISLPGLDGLSLLRCLKKNQQTAEIPVVMLSGSESDDDVRAAAELGAHSHFNKPISAHDFDWVTTAIRRYRERIQALSRI
jgi:two-component system, chemotaxis family, response regulator Rcp1